MSLEKLVEKYGTDKNLSGYTPTYERLFTPVKDKVKNVLEIGLGTLDATIVSTFVGNTRLYPHYKPGGSLRVWRDFFPNAEVYGVDIAKDCMFTEDRIKTFLFDSSNSDYVEYYLEDLNFDVIIDDGNHDPKYQMATLENLINKLNPGGIYVIEDIGGYPGTEDLLVDYKNRFEKITKEFEVENRGNHIVIVKPSKNITPLNEVEKTEPIEVSPNREVEVREVNVDPSKEYTIVSGLWDLGRKGRGFEDFYLPRFREFLKIDAPMILFLPKELHSEVWNVRSVRNTVIKTTELEDIERLYAPFWENTQKIRKSTKWLNQTGEEGWLTRSPQATLKHYNAIVQSKMFMLHDASLYNNFNTDYFYWVDAGLTTTVPATHLANDRCLDHLVKHTDPFLFLSYPYQSESEIHGFESKAMDRYAGSKVQYVCRGGLFGGHKDQISIANNTYYGLLQQTLAEGYMGTEESIFTIMAYNSPHEYRRSMLAGNGLIVKFTQELLEDTVELVEVKAKRPKNIKNVSFTPNKYKTHLYILTFNFPKQLEYTIESMKQTPEWLEKPKLFLLDNSTNKKARKKNKKIARENNFEYIPMGGNIGICGGRQFAAEHFHDSDADFYFFFEDDMTSNPPSEEGKFCRNGLRKYIPNLYNLAHSIMLKEDFDYLKLSFTEVFWDNDIQTSWYNVPQDVRTKFWPDYDQLPITGKDPNAPRTEFDKIGNTHGLAYISGDITYTNWPMIMSKKGNQKVFIDTKWARPLEQTWMSYVFQLQKEGEVNAAVLLASPIWHERLYHYTPEERVES